ncbi:YcnI family protein [Mesorhizobium sp.]|uniref:YcnI family copper-binding membrane protein n=1 Tax=Mesorhizobium sp. TaxID=1871066 RepID=UPI0025D7DF22|nr:YcnI family protein [Mesorhizobium sp.]
MKTYFFAMTALFALGTNAALAHITLETQEAAVGSTYKAVLRVPHGCAGKATTAVRVQIPEGVISVKPMPKPGWTLQTKKGKYEKSYQLYGETLTSGVKEVDWSGGNLPDEFYDEFVFRASLAADLPVGQMLRFPVVQECDDAAERWIEIPAEGQDSDALENPAPGIKLLPKK